MQNDNLISLLKKENEQLQFELNDLEYLITLREEELLMLKNKVASITELQSRYDQQLYHMEQLQGFVKVSCIQVPIAYQKNVLIFLCLFLINFLLFLGLFYLYFHFSSLIIWKYG